MFEHFILKFRNTDFYFYFFGILIGIPHNTKLVQALRSSLKLYTDAVCRNILNRMDQEGF